MSIFPLIFANPADSGAAKPVSLKTHLAAALLLFGALPAPAADPSSSDLGSALAQIYQHARQAGSASLKGSPAEKAYEKALQSQTRQTIQREDQFYKEVSNFWYDENRKAVPLTPEELAEDPALPLQSGSSVLSEPSDDELKRLGLDFMSNESEGDASAQAATAEPASPLRTSKLKIGGDTDPQVEAPSITTSDKPRVIAFPGKKPSPKPGP